MINDHIRIIKKYYCLSPFRKYVCFFIFLEKKNHVHLSFAIYFSKSHELTTHTYSLICFIFYIYGIVQLASFKRTAFEINKYHIHVHLKNFNGRLCLCGTLIWFVCMREEKNNIIGFFLFIVWNSLNIFALNFNYSFYKCFNLTIFLHF